MDAEVILTDLAEAQEIATQNISQAKLAERSSLTFQELNWEGKLPKGLNDLDLVVAADCTYNADSSPALVDTIQRLAKCSPGVTVLVAMKKRHESEDVFFEYMTVAQFKTTNVITVPLPGDEGNSDDEVHIYMYQYRLSKKRRRDNY
jgi:folylpolyglutamate synthase/dihydropteroate synthase